jgi:5-methylcytosine-specific restriction endonuclease McrA
MARYRGTTAERGLGAPHVADKKRLMALHRDGDPCWRCGKPMFKAQGLHRGHIIDRALGGAEGPAALEHPWCNLQAGARLGNKLQPRVIMAAGHDVRCGTCGKPYHYAARACEVCGVHYHPSGKAVRTCSRTCGVVLRRRLYGHAGKSLPRPKPAPKPRRPGPVASGEREPKGGRPAAAVAYYTCRYCGELGVTRASARQQREVCPARACQLARLGANNLRLRNGVTREDADAQMAYVVRRASRQW